MIAVVTIGLVVPVLAVTVLVALALVPFGTIAPGAGGGTTTGAVMIPVGIVIVLAGLIIAVLVAVAPLFPAGAVAIRTGCRSGVSRRVSAAAGGVVLALGLLVFFPLPL